jgi:hypothetical protein
MRTIEVSKVEVAGASRPALDRNKAIADLLSVPAPAEALTHAPVTYEAASIRTRAVAKRLSRVEQA